LVFFTKKRNKDFTKSLAFTKEFMTKKNILFFIFSFLAFSSFSQDLNLSGKIVEGNQTVIGATVVLLNNQDSSIFKGTVSDFNGDFTLKVNPNSNYILKVSFVGFKSHFKNINTQNADLNLGIIKIKTDAELLDAVVIEETAVRVEQKGDTSSYNAAAFKTNPDANVEDLVGKMPGISVENGVVKAQGEEVKKVLIDGKEFFGEDATLALKNLPAEIVEKIQVFDRLSEQAQFTGIDDGNTTKTINIRTKPGRNNGVFGRAYAGYGTDGRYNVGGMINKFKDVQRFSIIGMSNNINQQNFSSQDLVSALGAPSGGGGGRGRRGNDPASNFLSGNSAGISTTNSIGINYSNEWLGKIKFTGSYFFNYSQNENETDLERNYFGTNLEGQVYNETRSSNSDNYSNRLNFRFEYNIDSNNTIIITPKLNFQNNLSNQNQNGSTAFSDVFLNSSTNVNKSISNAINFANTFLYRHKFTKKGRNISINIDNEINRRDRQNNLFANNTFFTNQDTSSILNQESEIINNGNTVSANLEYNEPLSEKSFLSLNYQPSFTENISEKQTFNADNTEQYSLLDTLLSNEFRNEYFSQKVGLSYRYRSEKMHINIGGAYQNALLSGNQIFPVQTDISRTFENFLPNASFRYNFSKSKSFRVGYRTNTSAPSVSQLQNVIDNSNPLFLSSGNSDLKQSFSHNIMGRLSLLNAETARNFFLFIRATITDDYIGTSTIIARNDTLINNEVQLFRGGQYSKPVNLDDYYTFSAFATYGFPFSKIKSNFNLNSGLTFSNSPGLINNVSNITQTYVVSNGFTLSSNFSEKVDFSINYSNNYNIVNNNLNPNLNNNFVNQTAYAKVNLIMKEKWVINSDINYSVYSGLTQGFNQQFYLWNASLAYKFLKNNAGELRFSVFDLLKQNLAISRTVSETNVDDTENLVLSQYFMLTFTYNIRKFLKKEDK